MRTNSNEKSAALNLFQIEHVIFTRFDLFAEDKLSSLLPKVKAFENLLSAVALA